QASPCPRYAGSCVGRTSFFMSANMWTQESDGWMQIASSTGEQGGLQPAPGNPRVYPEPFPGRGARGVRALVVIAGSDGGGVALVGEVAQVEPGLPVVLRRGVAEGGAE